MRLIALLILAAALHAVEHSMPSWERDDHRLHFGAGVLAATGASVGVEVWEALTDSEAPRWVKVVAPLAASTLLGVAKEVYDHQHPDRHTTDSGDAIATAAGGLPVAFTFNVRF